MAGYTTWKNQLGRQVQKGQKGIRILAPSPYKQKIESEKLDPDTKQPMRDAEGKPITEMKEVTRPAFKVVNVFDVSQTEGRELPTLGVDELTGEVKDFDLFFEALQKTCPVPIAFEQIEGGAKGHYHQTEQRIAIQEGMSQLQTVKTAIHEMAHQKLHAIEPKETGKPSKDINTQTRNSKEVEAESVAYTICQKYGLDTSDYSFAYIAGWSAAKDTPELKASLQTIRQASSEMITAIDQEMEKLRSMRKERNMDSISYRLYQLKENPETTGPLHFMDMNDLKRQGMAVDGQNYALVYSGDTSKGSGTEEVLESLYERFNLYHPDDFRGHSLSVSDVIVLREDGRDQAYYVDSFGFQQVPEFFASNPLEKVEELLEDDYGMIDGIINNGDRQKEEKTEKSKSVRERLSEKKSEIADQESVNKLPEKEKQVTEQSSGFMDFHTILFQELLTKRCKRIAIPHDCRNLISKNLFFCLIGSPDGVNPGCFFLCILFVEICLPTTFCPVFPVCNFDSRRREQIHLIQVLLLTHFHDCLFQIRQVTIGYMVFISGLCITISFHELLTHDIVFADAVQYNMNMNITGTVVSVLMRADNHLMTGEVLSCKLPDKYMSLFWCEIIFVTVSWIEANNIVVSFDL